MLYPEVTINDILILATVILALACLYAGYRLGQYVGYQNGYTDGSKFRRKVERNIKYVRLR